MWLAILLSALAMTLIVGVRYLIVSGAFAWATRVRHPGLYVGLDRQMRRELFWSLASAAIYGIPAGVVAWGWQNLGWTRIYTDVSAYPLSRTTPGFTGRIAGCISRAGFASPMPCITTAARPLPGPR
jgi:hypothetical protein